MKTIGQLIQVHISYQTFKRGVRHSDDQELLRSITKWDQPILDKPKKDFYYCTEDHHRNQYLFR